MTFLKPNRTATYKPALAWFCALPLVVATCVLYAGGFTTSIEAGMAFLDWPLSNGSINPDGWLTEKDKMAEHGHRLFASLVGFLAIILAVWVWLREERAWLRWLSLSTLLMIILQGVMGGLRVRLDPLSAGEGSAVAAHLFKIAHALGAQIVVCMLVSVTVGLSRKWTERGADLVQPVAKDVRTLGIVLCGLILVQIFIGAVIRHESIGMAIPYFPHAQADGQLLPAAWPWATSWNFAHRAGAVLITLALSGFVGRIWGTPNTRKAFGWMAIAPLFILSAQIFVGATTIWTNINEHAATLHLLVGALLMASCWTLTFFAFCDPKPDSSPAANAGT